MPGKKLVIFDLDGTLIDSIKDLKEAVNFSLNKMGYEIHPLSSYKKFIGNGVSKLIKRAMPENLKDNKSAFEELKALFFDYYDNNLVVYTKEYEGVFDVLRYCQDKGIKLAVASNKYHKATVEIVENIFEDFKFSAILGQRDGIPTKPSPDIVNEIVELCNVSKHEVLFVGDSLVDVKTAKNADVEVCAVTWGYENYDKLLKSDAEYFALKPNDLLKLF